MIIHRFSIIVSTFYEHVLPIFTYERGPLFIIKSPTATSGYK